MVKVENNTSWEIQDWVEEKIKNFVKDNPQKKFLVCKIYSKKKSAYYCYDLEIKGDEIHINRAYKEPVQIKNEMIDKTFDEQKTLLNTLDQELINLKQELVEKSEGCNSEFSMMRNKINKLEQTIHLIKSEIKDLKTKYDKTFQKFMIIDEKIEHLEEHVEK